MATLTRTTEDPEAHVPHVEPTESEPTERRSRPAWMDDVDLVVDVDVDGIDPEPAPAPAPKGRKR